MFKSTHEKISRYVYQDLENEYKEYFSLTDFLKGSRYPDTNFKFRLMNHTFDGAMDFSLDMVNKIIIGKTKKEDLGFKLGVITHFLQDMTSAYHSNPKYTTRFSEHRGYAKKIEAINIDSLKYETGLKFTDLKFIHRDMKNYIKRFHAEDRVASPVNDLINAISITKSLIHLIMKEYIYQSSINFSVDDQLNKVVVFSDTYYPHINGVSNTIKQYLNYLKNNRIPYLLVCPKYDDILWEMEMGYHIYHANSVEFIFYPSTRMSIPNRKELFGVLDELKPDVAHALTEFNLGLFGQRYAQKRNIPFISNYSSFFHIQLEHYNLGFVEKPVIRYLDWFHASADLTTTPSQMSKDFLLENGLSNVEVFSRGVDRERFHPKFRSDLLRNEWNASKKIVFLFSGRVSGEKDITVLCDAYETMPKKYKDKCKVVVAGDGPELEELKEAYKDVIFTGFKTGKDLSEIYASADIFAFPSWSETFGNVVLEALGSGVPAIVVNQGGVLAQIIDDVNGVIVPKQNMPEFRAAMIRMLDNPKLVERYRLGALKTADERTWERVFDKLQKDYANLIMSYNKKKNTQE